ncbi:MAG: nitroreductase family deazaflavin-dependent oxidoreductase [Chloroflexota bacterium]
MNDRSLIHRLSIKTAGLARPFAGRRWFRLYGIVEHRGRNSGRPFRTPVVVRSLGDALVVPVPFGEGTQWLRNLVAAGGGTVVWGGRRIAVTEPEVVDRAVAEPAFSGFQRKALTRSGIDHFARLRRAAA